MENYSKESRPRSWLKYGSKWISVCLLSASLFVFAQSSSALELDVLETKQDQTAVPSDQLLVETGEVTEHSSTGMSLVGVEQSTPPIQELAVVEVGLSVGTDALEQPSSTELSPVEPSKIEKETLSIEQPDLSVEPELVAEAEATTVLPELEGEDVELDSQVTPVLETKPETSVEVHRVLPSMDASELFQILEGQRFLPEQLDPDLFQQTLVIQGQAATVDTVAPAFDEAKSVDLGDGSELYILDPMGKILSALRPVADQDRLYRLDALTKHLLDVYKVFYQVRELSPTDDTEVDLGTPVLPVTDVGDDVDPIQEVDLGTDDSGNQEILPSAPELVESPQEEKEDSSQDDSAMTVPVDEPGEVLPDSRVETSESETSKETSLDINLPESDLPKEETSLEQDNSILPEESVVSQGETVDEIPRPQTEDKVVEEIEESGQTNQPEEAIVIVLPSQEESTFLLPVLVQVPVTVAELPTRILERLIVATSQFLAEFIREVTVILLPTETVQEPSPGSSPSVVAPSESSSLRVLPFFPKAVARLDESGDLYLAPPTMARQLTLAYDHQGVTLHKTDDDDWQGSGIDFTYDKESGYLIIPQESLPSNTSLTIQSTDETGQVLDEQVYDIVDEPRPPHVSVWSQSLLIQPTEDVEEFLVEYKDDRGQHRRILVVKNASGKWITDNTQFVADNDGTLILPLKQFGEDSDIAIYTQGFDYVWSRLELSQPKEKSPSNPARLTSEKETVKRRLTLQK